MIQRSLFFIGAACLFIFATIGFYSSQTEPDSLSAQSVSEAASSELSLHEQVNEHANTQLMPTLAKYQQDLGLSRMGTGECYTIPWVNLFDVRGVMVEEQEFGEPPPLPRVFLAPLNIDVNGDGMTDRVFSQTPNLVATNINLVHPAPTLYLATGDSYEAAPICPEAYPPPPNPCIPGLDCFGWDPQPTYFNWDKDAYHWYLANDSDPLPCVTNPSGGRYTQSRIDLVTAEFYLPSVVDVNGDGLQDLVQSYAASPNVNHHVDGSLPHYTSVYINTGQGFKAASVCP